MSFFTKHKEDIKPLLLIMGIFLLVRIIFISLMPHTYSKDLYAWLAVIDLLTQGGDPYSTMHVLNWPPFWMQVLYAIHVVSKYTSISAVTLIQGVLIAGEAMVILVTYGILKRFFHQQRPAVLVIIALALNPVSIFLSCQHCNFDVFVGLWILLFTYALLDFFETRSAISWLIACFFLGMGILTKTVPLVLSPLLLIGIQDHRRATKCFGLMLLFTPVLIGMSIILTLAHEGVMRNVIGYRSMAGWYGITGILGLFRAWDMVAFYRTVSPLLMLCLVIFLTIRNYKTKVLKPVQLVTIVLLLLVALPTFGPGYSPPYINWFLPLLVIFFSISTRPVKRFIILGYVVVACTYCVEYAFFDSHGAFLTKLIPSQKMLALSDLLGSQPQQVLIRLPMFACYIILFLLLLKDFNKQAKIQAPHPSAM